MKKIVSDWSTKVRLTEAEAVGICKLGGGSATCAFLVVGEDGFECLRMSYPEDISIFARIDEWLMYAMGRGERKGCPWEDIEINGEQGKEEEK